jgi:hypothetical protein
MAIEIQEAKPLKPYTTVTHIGKSMALVLPDGEGDLTLYANNAEQVDVDGHSLSLIVHGIAAMQGDRPVVAGRKLAIKRRGSLVEFVPTSALAKPQHRLILKQQHEVTKLHDGEMINFVYDDKAPGWRQV